MTSTINVTDVVHQIGELVKQLEPAPAVDPKFEVEAEFVEMPANKVKPLLAAWHQADENLKAAKATLESIKQTIIDEMGKAETLVIAETGQHVVDHRVVTAMVIDTAKLKKDHAELVAGYQKERVSRPFKVLA